MDSYQNASQREILDKRVPQKLDELSKTADRLNKIADEQDEKYSRDGAYHSAIVRETRTIAVQSLARMALQIKELSADMIRALDFETQTLESKINDLQHCHLEIKTKQEKATRRDIGRLTHSVTKETRNPVTYPAQPLPRPPHHVFSDIDFSALDDIGHAAQDYSQSESETSTLSSMKRSSTLTSKYSVKSEMVVRPSVEFSTPKSLTLSRNYPRHSTFADHRKSTRSEAYSTVQLPTSRSSTAILPRQILSFTESFLNMANESPTQSGKSSPITPCQNPPKSDDLPSPPEIKPTCVPPPPPIKVDDYLKPSPSSATIRSDSIPTNYIEKAIVIYDYVAQKPDELNLHENNIVYIVNKNADGWYEGVLDGITGLFPGNYVQKI